MLYFPSNEVEETFRKHAHCPYCQSTQLQSDSQELLQATFICKQCGEKLDLSDILKDVMPEDSVECPDCESPDVINGVCFDCGFELEVGRDYEQEKYLQYLMAKND